MQELTSQCDVESGEKISAAKIYRMIRAQKEEEPLTAYWYPDMDGDGWRCSNCNHDICYLGFEGTWEKFCRNCGAEMINASQFVCENNKAWRLN